MSYEQLTIYAFQWQCFDNWSDRLELVFNTVQHRICFARWILCKQCVLADITEQTVYESALISNSFTKLRIEHFGTVNWHFDTVDETLRYSEGKSFLWSESKWTGKELWESCKLRKICERKTRYYLRNAFIFPFDVCVVERSFVD